MQFLGMHIADWSVIILYLIGVTALGVWAVRKVAGSASFFMGNRKYGKIFMMFFMFGSGTHSDQAISVAAKTYRAGASGIWYQWIYLFATPFFWVLAPIFRRMRALTTGDYFVMRYGAGVGMLFVVIAILQMMVDIGMLLKGSGAMITAVSGGAINANMAIFATTIMFVIYGVAGGLNAAIITDFVQGILTIVLSVMIFPIALNLIGGIDGLHAKIADPDMMRIVAKGEINAFFIAIVALNGLIGWVVQPVTLPNCAAGETELEGQIGVTTGVFLKRLCTICWMLTGLCAIAYYVDRQIKSDEIDQVYGLMAHDLLPNILPGLLGIFIASMLAGIMSACSSVMVTAGAMFTENVYKPLINKTADDKHYTLVGRIASALMVFSGIIFAYSLESMVSALELFWMIAALMGVAFFVGLFWRGATAAGAWAGTLVSFAALALTSKIPVGSYVLWDFNARFADSLPNWMLYEGKLYLPWQMIIYLVSGFVALVAVSLVTKREPKDRLDRFYECIRTPVVKGEHSETTPFTLPAGVTPAPRRVLIQHPDFEIPVPSARSVIGFLLSWVGVGVLIGFVYWILR